MSSFLQQVCGEALARVAEDRALVPLDSLVWDAEASAQPPSLAAALDTDVLALIAEVKRASPSRGHMADIDDPAALALAYVEGGASAVSVLTEPAHFGGSLDDLITVTAAVDVPVLRKDFMIDAYQIWQARKAGAAAVLLIVAALDDDRLIEFMTTADEAELDCLVETHSATEVARAVDAHQRADTGRRLILGVNARDLATLEIDRSHVARVREEADLPDDALLVAESGIRGPDDVAEYAALGADAVLVGEHVATAEDPTAAVRALLHR